MNRTWKIVTMVSLSAAIVMTGASLAYFTDGDEAVNTFTIGKVALDLQEPDFDEASAVNLVPNQEITKDPLVKNTGINDEYVFLEVTVPAMEITTVSEDGTTKTTKRTEVFTYSVNNAWALMQTDKSTAGNTVYVYAYKGKNTAAAENTVLATLSLGETTPELFHAVKLINAVEDQNIEGTSLQIGVKAYGIQSDYINSGDGAIDGTNAQGADTAGKVWSVLAAQAPASADRNGEDISTDI